MAGVPKVSKEHEEVTYSTGSPNAYVEPIAVNPLTAKELNKRWDQYEVIRRIREQTIKHSRDSVKRDCPSHDTSDLEALSGPL